MPDDLDSRSALVAVVAPVGQDGAIAVRILRSWQLQANEYPNLDALASAIRGGVGAVRLCDYALLAT